MRTIGLDIGEKRIGVAVSDPSGRVATPLCVLQARGLAADIAPLRRIVEDYEVKRLVVGLPLTMAGEEGPQALEVRRIASALSERLGMAVAYQDERLTSKVAERAMSEAGAGPRARRGRVDMVAAALLLQTYLDAPDAS
jgi:putative Holliday junction resolvase